MIRKGPGLIHIYCGDGKGKTTAGMGLCLRAAGYGYRVLICQFLKDNSTSERKVLAGVDNITLLPGQEQVKFSFQMTEEEKREQKDFNEKQLEEAMRKAAAEHYDVLFLDEAVYAVSAGLLSEGLLEKALREKPENLEVILTGQNPGQELLSMADYVSEICKVKHPFDRQQPAREGIER